jgi:hypothetical protein
MESNEKLDLDTSKVESKDKWQMFDILNVKRPTIAKLKESLTLAKQMCANLEANYITEQLDNDKLLNDMAKVNNDNMLKEHTIERLKTDNKAHKETIDSLKKQLMNAHNRAEKAMFANRQLASNRDILKATIDNLEGQLSAKKAVKSYPLIAVVIIAIIEAVIIFCLV